MEILPPAATPQITQAAPAVTPVSREERQHDLLLHQMIRATVEESGQDKALLQFGDRRQWVETGTPLKAGDTLNLQVVATKPTLAFKIIEPTLLDRLGHSLHLLGSRLEALDMLPDMLEGREPGSKNLGPEVRGALNQLLGVLKTSPEQLNGPALRELPRQLGLFLEAELLDGQPEAARATLKNALGQLGENQSQLRQELGAHLAPLLRGIMRLPEMLQTPAQAEALVNRQPTTIANVLRPLLRLAETVPESQPAGPSPAMPARTSQSQAPQASVLPASTAQSQSQPPIFPVSPVQSQSAQAPAIPGQAQPTQGAQTQHSAPAATGALPAMYLRPTPSSEAPIPATLRQEAVGMARDFVQALREYLQPPTATTLNPALGRLEQAVAQLPSALAGGTLPPAESETAPLAGLTRLIALLRQPATELDGEGFRTLPRQLGLQSAIDGPARPTGTLPGAARNASGQPVAEPGRGAEESAPRLEQLAEQLARIPKLLRAPSLIGTVLNRQPPDLAAVLRPLLRFAEAAATPPTVAGSTPTAGISQPSAAGPAAAAAAMAAASPDPAAAPQPGISPPLPHPATAARAQEFVQALREYLRPFAELTEGALDRVEQQLALLPLIVPGPYEQALTAIGQKPQGKDLLGAIFHLLRGTPERLAGGSGENLTRQIVEALKKTVEQNVGRVEERQDETLRHLELWQLCRARLGDIDTTFVPLPLPFLDNGFLVARRQTSEEADPDSPEETVTLSLFLDLRKLGFLQVDLLYQHQELFVRFKCQDQDAADAFTRAREELGETLAEIPLSAFAVSVDAESPDRALIRKLIPPERGLLNARI